MGKHFLNERRPLAAILVAVSFGMLVGAGGCALTIARLAHASSSGTVSFNNDRLTNVADPVAASDAATKNYVATIVASQ